MGSICESSGGVGSFEQSNIENIKIEWVMRGSPRRAPVGKENKQKTESVKEKMRLKKDKKVSEICADEDDEVEMTESENDVEEEMYEEAAELMVKNVEKAETNKELEMMMMMHSGVKQKDDEKNYILIKKFEKLEEALCEEKRMRCKEKRESEAKSKFIMELVKTVEDMKSGYMGGMGGMGGAGAGEGAPWSTNPSHPRV